MVLAKCLPLKFIIFSPCRIKLLKLYTPMIKIATEPPLILQLNGKAVTAKDEIEKEMKLKADAEVSSCIQF